MHRRSFLAATGTAGIGAFAGCLDLLSLTEGEDRLEWTFETVGDVYATPVLDEETMYIPGRDGFVYALDPASGELVWRFDSRNDESPLNGMFSGVAVEDGLLYFGSANYNVYALDIEEAAAASSDPVDIDPVWTYETRNPVQGSPIVNDDLVYVGSTDNTIYALDRQTGDYEWSFETGDDVLTTPTLDDGILYTGSDDGNLYALNADTGEEQWRYSTDREIRGTPTVTGELVYVAGHDRNLHAVDKQDGSPEWEYRTTGPVNSTPTVADGTVYLGGYDHVYAIGAKTGAEEWSAEVGGRILRSSPQLSDTTLYIGSVGDPGLYAFEIDSGEQQWRFEPDGYGEIHGSLTVSDDRIYFGTLSTGHVTGKIYAITT